MSTDDRDILMKVMPFRAAVAMAADAESDWITSSVLLCDAPKISVVYKVTRSINSASAFGYDQGVVAIY